MQQPSPVRRLRPGPLLLVAASALLSASAPGAAGADVDDDDHAPPGMVAFFLASGPSCPPGWVPLAEGQGRLVVGVTGSVDVGVQVGAPLGDKEDRAHRHLFSGQGPLPYKAIAATDGGNRSGAKAGGVSLSGQTEPAPSGLPFIQLLQCEKR